MPIDYVQQFADQYGLFTYVLPWLVMFAIFFGLLETINVFKKKNVNLLLALVMSVFAVSSNVGTPVAAFMIKLFQSTGIVLSGLFVLLLLLGTLGLGMRKEGEEGLFGGAFESHKATIFVFGLLVALIIFINSGGMMFLGNERASGDVITLVVWVIIILLALSWLLGGRKQEKSAAEKLADALQELEKKKR